MSSNSPTCETTVTWSHIAGRRCENDIQNTTNDVSNDRQQDQITLLQEALRCPQEIPSGVRVCLECGRRFHDVFRLAQHIKDKHRGEPLVCEEKQRPVLSEFVQFPPLESSSTLQPKDAGSLREKKTRPKRDDKKVGRSKDKKVSSLKKAYLREKSAQLRESWSLVLSSLDENIQSLERMKEEIGEEKRAVVVDDCVMDWNALQVAYQKEQLVDRNLAKLHSMKDLCTSRLRHINARRAKDANRRSLEWSMPMHPKIKDEPVEDVEHTAQDDDDPPEEPLEEEADEFYDSEDSISSDDSFELQWGDTLQTWAQNMGHMNLKHLSIADDGSKHEDAKPIIVRDDSIDRKKEQAIHDNATKTPGTVRIISTHQKKEESVKDVQETEHKSAEESDSLCVVDLLPEVFQNKPTSCSLCGIPSLGLDEWEAHQKSDEHRKKLLAMATRELHIHKSITRVPLTKGGYLSTNPKKYTGPDANVEAYVSHIITDELNQKVSEFLSKLISWQERSRRMDPMNAKKKKRLVCGMREAAKAVKQGKVKALIVSPNVQPLSTKVSDTGEEVPSYPVDSILQDCDMHGVPVCFALTRRKMGNLLGQRKSVSLFAVLNISGAEDDFKALESMLQNLSVK